MPLFWEWCWLCCCAPQSRSTCKSHTHSISLPQYHRLPLSLPLTLSLASLPQCNVCQYCPCLWSGGPQRLLFGSTDLVRERLHLRVGKKQAKDCFSSSIIFLQAVGAQHSPAGPVPRLHRSLWCVSTPFSQSPVCTISVTSPDCSSVVIPPPYLYTSLFLPANRNMVVVAGHRVHETRPKIFDCVLIY